MHEQINIQSKYDMKMKIFRRKWLDLADSIKQILVICKICEKSAGVGGLVTPNDFSTIFKSGGVGARGSRWKSVGSQ